MMYRVRKKVSRKINGKLEDQYSYLGDYYEILRMTNKGSYVMMKVDTPKDRAQTCLITQKAKLERAQVHKA